MMKKQLILSMLLASGCLLGGTAMAAEIKIAADDIGGTVTSAKGPEAGVWVIAEAKDLPAHYVKSVVTDDQGRYVMPALPKGNYKLWVRGYGLVDSTPVEATPGSQVDLNATVAPSAKDAAQYYPAAYWYAMLNPPPESDFPGTGSKGNGIAPVMLTQQHWLHNMKENCMFCHQLGDKATRELAVGGNSVEAWGARIQMARTDDQAIGGNGASLSAQMQNNMARFGRGRGLKMYADWTDRIAAGATPTVTPKRPEGVERNIVVTVQDWGAGHYVHDQISSDHRDPGVNAGGPIYGMGTLGGYLEVFDPKTMTNSTVPIPALDGSNGHKADAGVHADEMDGKGRVWMPTIYKEGPEPAYCKDGSSPYSKYYPLSEQTTGAVLPVYDPATKKLDIVPMCAGGNHGNFSFDGKNTLYMSGDLKVISWIDTNVWDKTHDPKQATGWCPMVIDTSGDGKIDPDHTKWNAAENPLKNYGGGEDVTPTQAMSAAAADKGAPFDPKKDTQFSAALYGMSVGKDGSIWEAAYVPYVPSAIVRMTVGAHPPETCKTEVYQPPLINGKYAAFGIRGVGVDGDGVAWAAFSSGQVGRFDRRKCKVFNGPTALGQQCPEGWTFLDLPSPHVGNTSATSDFVYSEWNDFKGVMGLGENAKFFPAINSDSVVALRNGGDKFINFRVPYPMGFYTRGVDFRVDDPKAGWKGRVMHATYASATPWHQEDGEGSTSKIVSFQMRPDPLAD
jgi:hypothetical protein